MYFGGIGERATLDAVANAGLILDDRHVVPEDEGDGHLAYFLWLVAQARPTAPGWDAS
jgi:hypothetical protein